MVCSARAAGAGELGGADLDLVAGGEEGVEAGDEPLVPPEQARHPLDHLPHAHKRTHTPPPGPPARPPPPAPTTRPDQAWVVLCVGGGGIRGGGGGCGTLWGGGRGSLLAGGWGGVGKFRRLLGVDGWDFMGWRAG